MSDLLSIVVLIVYLTATVGMACFMVSYFAQLRRHCVLRPAGRAAEERLLATPLPKPEELPHVVVQIVSFNEGPLVRRALQAAALLDWPRDRLHLQLLDDSTDDTLAHGRAAVAALQATGLDVVLLHRERRDGFKAGALADGMAASPHEYFAIFDTDYVPQPDFLRRCMTALLADASGAFVQARIDYLNADESALTRTQALMLDHHMSVDQMTRSWAGHPLPFNGTCGIWRRSAIEAAGGWRGDTLAEDLDLTYRAWMLGLGGRFLATVSAPGELPTALKAWANQQYRWTTGFGQVAWRILPLLPTARVPGFRRKLWALMHLGPAVSGSLVGAAQISLIVLLVLQPGWAWLLLGTTGVLFLVGLLAHILGLAVGQRTVRGARPRRGFVMRCLHIMALQMLVAWLMTWRSLKKPLSQERVEFVRTPKRGALRSSEPDQLV
jgi:cellulose synthase/poly-beta-1,6-N-acetylglucosamine synthase-like glycosyltransferase